MPNFSVSPCLFIGIGTNGWNIIDELRKLCFEEFGVAGLPCFRYVAFETNGERRPDNSFLPHEPKPYECIRPVYITIPDVSVIKQRIDPKLDQTFIPGLKEWLDVKLIERGIRSFITGAGNARHAGRLCLWENWSSVKGELTTAYKELTIIDTHTEADHFLREEYLKRKELGGSVPQQNLVNTALKVYIFGTLCGGTCSGAFIDIAYYVSNLIGIKRRGNVRHAMAPQVIGMFTIPDYIRVSETNIRTNIANCWAALRELDFYYQPDSVYSVKFPDGTTLKTKDEPFDFVYLQGMTNVNAFGFGDRYEHLVQLCAMNLFTEVVAGMGSQKDEIRVNLRAAAPGYMQPNQTGHIRAFHSFGLSAIWYPRYRIAKAINRHLGSEMCSAWLGAHDANPGPVNDQCSADWDELLMTTGGKLTGTVSGAHCNVNLYAEVANLFAQNFARFQNVPVEQLSDFTINFPEPNNTFAQRFSNPGGEDYIRMADIENLVARDLKKAVEERVLAFARSHTLAETQIYVDALIRHANDTIQAIPDEIPNLSQQMDFGKAHDVHGDVWTKWVGRLQPAIQEYRNTIWQAFQSRVIAHLDRIRNCFIKSILKTCLPDLEALSRRVLRAQNRLSQLKETCDAQKKELVSIPVPANIIPISSEAAGIAEDVNTGAAEILKAKDTNRNTLKTLFLGEQNPLEVLDMAFDSKLIPKIDQAFASLSQRIISRFHIGSEAVAKLKPRIGNLVSGSGYYVETAQGYTRLPTPQSPNFIFSHEGETGKVLADLANDHIKDPHDAFRIGESPLNHFVFFYQEIPGLAISDLLVCEFAHHVLDDEEKNRKVSTHYSHQSGEKMFNLAAIRDLDKAERWISTIVEIAPGLFKNIGGTLCLEYTTREGLKRDLAVQKEEALRDYLERYGWETLRRIFVDYLKNLGQTKVLDGMNARLNKAQTMAERQAIQNIHEEIFKEVFSPSQP